MIRFILSFMIGLCLLTTSYAGGGSTCNAHFVMPSDIDWDGLFPMSFGSIPVAGGDTPDTDNNPIPVCMCPAPPPVFERIGLSFGYWEPDAEVDVTKTPFCMVNMGFKLSIKMKTQDIGGTTTNHENNYVDGNFFHLHWYKSPWAYLLNLLTDVGCLETGSLDLAYMSEFDPTWQDDQLSMIINPEAVLFGNMIADLACTADAIKTIPNSQLPIDALFWCMGSNGNTYPLDGNNITGYTPIQSATLLQEKFNFKLHREGIVQDSSPATGAMCYTQYKPIMPKSRYRYEMVNQTPDLHVHPYGHMTYLWETGHNNPTTGNDFGFLVWRKRNCCLM
jgi:conjugal transfer pilus assembly protein TraU